ncbi:DoxX family membrane protein [Dactylosporangium sp. AC04546]|nr:DoxX family membrane protein [Dactylosporangium sp. AC04546]WVK89776.1 DoxX family membrane protein [Dactylosporangium sp. AC04546]
MLTRTAARGLAVLRYVTGSVFLWAFADKVFGLGYATPEAKAWINGGNPTKGFLANVDAGPLQGFFHTIAGTWYANWLFMLGLLGVGVALFAGIGLRIAAVSGSLLMAGMWLAEFPPTAAGSTNPFTDYHIIYAVVLIVLAAAYAGHTWGLGRRWAKLPIVQRNRWLI